MGSALRAHACGGAHLVVGALLLPLRQRLQEKLLAHKVAAGKQPRVQAPDGIRGLPGCRELLRPGPGRRPHRRQCIILRQNDES